MSTTLSVPLLLLAYYKEIGNDNFPKTKKGLPDMRAAYNHSMWRKCQKIEKEKKRKEEAIVALKSTFHEIESGSCAICYEPMVYSHASLKCKHNYCLDCFSKHCRNDNKCPLCRDEFAPMVKKPLVAPSEYKEAIAYMVIQSKQYKYKGTNIELPQYIYNQMTDYMETKNESIFNEIIDTISLSIIRSIRATCTYYDTQIE